LRVQRLSNLLQRAHHAPFLHGENMRSTRFTALCAFAALSFVSMLATADTTAPGSAASSEAQPFKAQEKTMQQLSTPMPSSSAPVNRAQPPADAVPKARTRAERIERFRQLEDAMQRESSG
jgi:hypothetical protein